MLIRSSDTRQEAVYRIGIEIIEPRFRLGFRLEFRFGLGLGLGLGLGIMCQIQKSLENRGLKT
ncbi:hypothetical protein VCR14J2_260227 [Vibrio coralliirubri]|nr:hypothetical protein VCR14J2_260227 [Vibrio coralliirubri]